MKSDYSERVLDELTPMRQMVSEAVSHLWSALPCLVVKFDAEKLTVDLQPTIKGRITNESGEVRLVDLPILLDAPVIFPHAGGVSLTFPIKEGDECLAVFSDRCIDAWWQSGGVQAPISSRMHDLSDAFALFGVWSQATKITQVSTGRFELRTDDRQAFLSFDPKTHDVELETVANVTARVGKNSTVTISGNATVNIGGNAQVSVSGSTTVTSPTVTVNASSGVTFDTPQANFSGMVTVAGLITGGGGLSISGGTGATVSGSVHTTGEIRSDSDIRAGGISLMRHTHSGVSSGGSNTGSPN